MKPTASGEPAGSEQVLAAGAGAVAAGVPASARAIMELLADAGVHALQASHLDVPSASAPPSLLAQVGVPAVP
jgi:hypothetical protein